MKVFVAGATGALGRPLVSRLVAAGHEVTGTTRSPQKAAGIEAAGASAAVCDALDADRLREAVAAARPEVVVHALTALPETLDYRRPERTFGPTNRLRREGTRNLVDAASAAGARRLVAESIAFAYAPDGPAVRDETAPLNTDQPGPLGEVAKAVAELERQVLEADRIEGVVLRYGFFYGPGTYLAPGGSQAAAVRARKLPIVGRGGGLSSFVHVDDAAAATLAAVEAPRLSGVFHIADDEPAPMSEWLPFYAETIGARSPMRVPALLARLAAGKALVAAATRGNGASNAKAKTELGWSPRYPSWRNGFREALG